MTEYAWAAHQILFVGVVYVLLARFAESPATDSYILYAWTIIGVLGFAVVSAVLVYQLASRRH